jgi:hypothetical protein
MNQTKRSKGALWVGIVAAGVGLLVFSLLLPTVYAYNDDAMMLSIVSGGYTGTPDGHMIYVAYPLSGILALLYRLAGGIPWFPLLISSCYGAAAAGVWYRLLSSRGNALNRILTAGLLSVGSLLFLLPGYIGLHYTLTAAILGGAGIVWFLTGSESVSVRGFGRDQIGTMVYLLLCCMVRKQVFYLLLPFLGLAIVWKIALVMKERRTMMIQCSGIFLGMLAAGLLIIWGCNQIAYGSEDWKKYETYNEARTKLYDYSGFLSYDAYQETYEELHITKMQYLLMENYDLMLDTDIDAAMMEELAKRYLDVKWGEQSVKQRIMTAIWEYRQCLLLRRDMPYSLAVLAGYALLILLCIGYRRFVLLGLAAAAVLGRSLIWIFLFYQGRFPERVTVSLYLIELLLLSGLLAGLMQYREKRGKLLFSLGICLMLCMGAGIYLTLPKVWVTAKDQAEATQEWKYLSEYFRGHPDTFYLLDVDVMIPYTDQPFVPGRKTFENWMLLGGWTTASPTAAQKLEVIGAGSAGEALLSEQTRLVIKADGSKEWLDDYCRTYENGVQAVLVDTVTYEGEAFFSIYQVKLTNPTESANKSSLN